MSLWLTISIPRRLRDTMMLKEAFEVSTGAESSAFLDWWEKAGNAERDEVMVRAYDHGISLVDSLKVALKP